MKICRAILAFKLLLVLVLVAPSVAYAYLQDEIQVYDDEINAKGEYSLELHLNTTPRGNQQQGYPGEIVNNNNTRVTPELAYGLGHDLEAGFYLSYSNNNNSFNYAGVKARLKWLPYQEEKGHPFFAGVNFEVSKAFLDAFCVEPRKCVGPRGPRGVQGEAGQAPSEPQVRRRR